jgi:hypothetical protein
LTIKPHSLNNRHCGLDPQSSSETVGAMPCACPIVLLEGQPQGIAPTRPSYISGDCGSSPQ